MLSDGAFLVRQDSDRRTETTLRLLRPALPLWEKDPDSASRQAAEPPRLHPSGSAQLSDYLLRGPQRCHRTDGDLRAECPCSHPTSCPPCAFSAVRLPSISQLWDERTTPVRYASIFKSLYTRQRPLCKKIYHRSAGGRNKRKLTIEPHARN